MKPQFERLAARHRAEQAHGRAGPGSGEGGDAANLDGPLAERLRQQNGHLPWGSRLPALEAGGGDVYRTKERVKLQIEFPKGLIDRFDGVGEGRFQPIARELLHGLLGGEHNRVGPWRAAFAQQQAHLFLAPDRDPPHLSIDCLGVDWPRDGGAVDKRQDTVGRQLHL